MNEFGKYRLFRKYVSLDGVEYTPLDEYQALLVENNSCQCGYRELEYRFDGEYKNETFKKYEIWNEYSFCPTDSSYDELTGNVDYRNPIAADGVILSKYRGENTTSVKLCNNYDFYERIAINNVEKGRKYTNYAFNNTDINEVAYSNVTSIGNNTFSGCTYLQSVTIPDSVTSIGDKAFYNCSNLNSIKITDSVTSIGTSAFTKCTSLASVTIGSGVTSIGSSAFSGCTYLQSVTIPDSVTSIGSSAFTSCIQLSSVTIGSGITTIGNSIFYKCSGLTSVEIPDNVTSIGTSAFTNCRSLRKITIGSGVTSIGKDAFYWCSRLSSITCYATTAPSLYVYSVFNNVPPNGTLHVPSGSDYSSWLKQLPSGWTIEYI